jgi:bifunctional ADP-heptose synthase (sugar kinase/adenylyltransferase)
VGSEGVRARGGVVEVIPLLPGRSTTNIIKKSRQ